MTMSDWTTAPDVISVGAYCANDIKRTLWKEPQQDENNTLGDIAAFSSFGVGINGVQCPTLSAPGVNVVSAISHYYIDLMNQMGGDFDDDDDDFNDEDDDFNDNDDLFYLSSSTPQFREEMMWNGFHYTGEEGTSQAAPAVAGTVALWLQADPSLTVAEIKDIIAQSCRTDEFTEASPERFGYGKVDAKRGMELVLERMSTGIQQLPDDNAISNHNIFMLDGRQVFGTPTRGIYIVNGKKVIVQ
jgi:subtilisin family serine protease